MDIIQLFGTSGGVAGTVLGAFELGERFASQRAKDALSTWLLSLDIHKAKALPDGTQELFERIFGERHFSLKCFVRSAVFSLGAMGFLTVLVLLIIGPVKQSIREFFFANLGLLLATLWILWSILIDYVSLFKTRVILRILTRLSARTMMSIGISVIDYFVYKVLYRIGMALYQSAEWLTLGIPESTAA
jgi:hypothetical protein